MSKLDTLAAIHAECASSDEDLVDCVIVNKILMGTGYLCGTLEHANSCEGCIFNTKTGLDEVQLLIS